MSVDIRQDGSFEVTYVGPYGGLNVQMPENLIKDTESPALNDVILRNAAIKSRPIFNANFVAAPEAGVGIAGIGAFQGTLWALMADGKFFTFNFVTGVWTQKGTASASVGAAIAVSRIFQNKLYLVNASSNLISWDGATFNGNVATVGGGATNVGATFLDELDNHLLMAVTNESGSLFGQRIRWSASGLPAVWDPAVNINAGLNDFLEVPDNITGLMMLGRVGYIIRSDGITEAAPTGNGIAPFDFNHLWASQFGIGGTKFYSSSQYGTTGVIIARDNIYSIQAFNIQPIGGGARDAILADIGFGNYGVNSGVVNSTPQLAVGIIVPYLRSDVIVEGSTSAGAQSLSSAPLGTFPYLLYLLMVPKVSALDGATIIGTDIWAYSFEDSNWVKWTLPGFNIVGAPSLIFGSNQNAGTPAGPLLAIPVKSNGGIYSIGVFNPSNFNDPSQGSSYSYKVEDVFPNRVPTVRRVAITYRDLGTATITLTLTGTDDNQTVQTATSSPITIGNVVPTNALMVKLVDLELTAFRPQLSWNRAPGAGPVEITRAVMIGQVEREVTL